MPSSRQACTAASTIAAGVGKSGSPAPKPTTSSPAARSALYFASTAKVADSAMDDTRTDNRLMPSCSRAPSRCREAIRSVEIAEEHHLREVVDELAVHVQDERPEGMVSIRALRRAHGTVEVVVVQARHTRD